MQSLKYSHLHLIDSLNMLLERVAKLSKIFNLRNIIKGHFPNYISIKYINVGTLPLSEINGCDDMPQNEPNLSSIGTIVNLMILTTCLTSNGNF